MTARCPAVHGIDLDPQTRCAHHRKPVDIVAIQMKCCGTYYACKDCHEALAGHALVAWPRAEWNRKAVLCGVCGLEMSIQQYMECRNQCPGCGARFNPACCNHAHFYFEAETSSPPL